MQNLPTDSANVQLLPSTDYFSDLSKLTLSQDFVSATAVKKVITTVAVRKPHKHEFIRVRSGCDWRIQTGCFTDKEVRETYMVGRDLWSVLPEEVTPTLLVTCVSRTSEIPFLWPLTLPAADGRPNRWHESAIDAAREAENHWVRVTADMSAGCYVPHVATGDLPEPTWVDYSFQELLRLAFKKDRLIDSIDHVVLKRLRGEV